MKAIKRPRTPEREVPKGNKRKVRKDWVLQMKGPDRYYFLKADRDPEGWAEHAYNKYMSVEHGIKELNKELRSWFGEGRFKNQEIRLFNKETKEKVNLIVENKLIRNEEVSNQDPGKE